MRKGRRRSYQKNATLIPWLPIDSRLFPHLFAFGHVKGLARIFLELEIAISLLVVLGTVTLVILNFLF